MNIIKGYKRRERKSKKMKKPQMVIRSIEEKRQKDESQMGIISMKEQK